MGASIWSYFGYPGEDEINNVKIELLRFSNENKHLQDEGTLLKKEIKNLNSELVNYRNNSFEFNDESSPSQMNELISLNNEFIQNIKRKLIDIQSKLKSSFYQSNEVENAYEGIVYIFNMMNDYDLKQKKWLNEIKKRTNNLPKKLEDWEVNLNQKMNNKQSFPMQRKLPAKEFYKKQNDEEDFRTILPNKMNFGQSYQDVQKKRENTFIPYDFKKNDQLESASNSIKEKSNNLTNFEWNNQNNKSPFDYPILHGLEDKLFLNPIYSKNDLKIDSNKIEKSNPKQSPTHNIFQKNRPDERKPYHQNEVFFHAEYFEENNPKKRKKTSVSKEKDLDSFKKNKNKDQNLNIFDPNLNPEKFVIPQQIIDYSLLIFEQNFNQLQINLNRKFNNIENASQIYQLAQFANEYENEAIKKKIFELSASIPFYRKIRGDGNCFFRAVAINYIERKIIDVDLQNLKNSDFFIFIQNIAEKKIKIYSFLMCANDYELENILMKNLFLDNYLKNKLSIILKKKLEMLSDEYHPNLGKINKTIKEEFITMLNKDKLFDLALIAMIRSIVIQNLFEKKDDPLYSPFMFDFENLKSALINYGQEAENLIITLAADAFNSKIIINMIHVDYNTPNRSVTLSIQEFIPLNEQKVTTQDINLFFRPGHYDIGYNLKDVDF